MRVSPTRIAGCHRIDLDRRADERGFFARSFCRDELAAAGIAFSVQQANWSGNTTKGTVRGMHYQRDPHGEPKIVSCVRGRMFDVFVDLRASSPTYLTWDSIELEESSLNAVYLPTGIAHGFQTLSDDVLVQYWMGTAYEPTAAEGLRHDDPVLAIEWPLPVGIVSERDRSWPLIDPRTRTLPPDRRP